MEVRKWKYKAPINSALTKLTRRSVDTSGGVGHACRRLVGGVFRTENPEADVHERGIQIGEVLIEQGVLTEAQVRHILFVQKACQRPFGDLAERLFGLSPRVIEGAWVTQFVRLSGVVDLNHVSIDPTCLQKLNRRQAWQFHVLPLYRTEEHLHLATSEENLVRAVNFAGRTFAEPVFFVVTDREQLRENLMKHYPVPQHIADFAEKM